MRAITMQGPFDFEQLKLAPPIAWALGVSAIVSVFAVVAIVVNYAPLNNDAKRRIESQLPPASYEAVGALIRATGRECKRVCAISPVTALTTADAVDVDCAGDDSVASCRTSIHYRINVAPNEGPKR